MWHQLRKLILLCSIILGGCAYYNDPYGGYIAPNVGVNLGYYPRYQAPAPHYHYYPRYTPYYYHPHGGGHGWRHHY
jgi:hypothetical protein